jgi:hypothetical protein
MLDKTFWHAIVRAYLEYIRYIHNEKQIFAAAYGH